MHCCDLGWVFCLQMPRSSHLYRARNLKRFAKAGTVNRQQGRGRTQISQLPALILLTSLPLPCYSLTIGMISIKKTARS